MNIMMSTSNFEYKYINIYFFCGVWGRVENAFALTGTFINCAEWCFHKNNSSSFSGEYSILVSAISIISGRAQKDVPLRTIVYSLTSMYTIFEASFMLLANLLMYHFGVFYQGRPSSCGIYTQQIFSQRFIWSLKHCVHNVVGCDLLCQHVPLILK